MLELRQGASLRGRRIVVTGRVQGVGFRPFVKRLACRLGLSGWVRNHAGAVHIVACGDADSLNRFVADLIARAPPFARPRLHEIDPCGAAGADGFLILDSQGGDLRGADVAPDQSVCEECLAEMRDPGARRHRYPFTNCTQCGPRYTIVRALPYDRASTTMAGFAMCWNCRREYADPFDRRFHAEPIACPDCGPQLRFVDPSGGSAPLAGDAIAAALGTLRNGMTVAVKGIGGYHLMCDATSETAVGRLRRAKRRPHKPFAVMVAPRPSDGRFALGRLAEIDGVEEAALLSAARPIVLVRRRRGAALASAVAPGLDEVGLMLPYSPLHELLLDAFGRPVVATSANISGEPVLTTAEDVELRLAGCCDAYLHHDRPIERPADDSVIRVIAGRPRILRLGRGVAPLAVCIPYRFPEAVLACGGQLKNTASLAFDDRVVVSPHIGDMGNLRSSRVFDSVAEGMQSLFGIRAQGIIHDGHPDFTSTRWARRQALPAASVQHHFAHASALAGEHGRTTHLLVFAWDGLGYGADGTLWGGETLAGSPGRWRRVGTFRSVRIVGGDRAALEPWRSACCFCWETAVEWGSHRPEFSAMRQVWQEGSVTQRTSSVGRLFDAAAALLGLAETASYDGQAPALLECAASALPAGTPLPVHDDGTIRTVDWSPLVPSLLDARSSVGRRAAAFHAALAATILAEARHWRAVDGTESVGLTGGVFQNRRLTEHAVLALERDGFEVLLHERVPPNDGGLSFGQAVEFAARSAGR
ncbi:MAG: carbamoyltransferase HypF [Xanthobacteraceae bacterium]|nr:carbamoyltransferase HypF [Xanthobacteraceae bacterium]